MKEIRYRWRGAAFCLALSLMAAGCSMTDDVECPPDGGDTPGMSDAFIQLSFGIADAQGTRANPDGGETGDDIEAGQDAENKVSTAVAFLFDGNVTVNGEASTPVTPVYFPSVTGPTETGGTGGIDAVWETAPVQTTVENGDYNVIVVANPGDNRWWEQAENQTLGAVRDHIQQEAWTETNGNYTNFLMSSADEPTEKLTINNNSESEPAKVTVNVERMAARVDYLADNEYTCTDPDYNGATVKITGATIVNRLTAGSYLLKRVADDVNGTNLEYLGDETATNTVATNYVLDPWTKLKTQQNLTTDTPPFTVNGQEVAASGLYDTETYIPTRSDNPKDWAGYCKAGVDATEDNYLRVGYALENTTGQLETSLNYNTGIVFKAQFNPKGVTGYTDGQTFFTYNGTIYPTLTDMMGQLDGKHGHEDFSAYADEQVYNCLTWLEVKLFGQTLVNDPTGYGDYLINYTNGKDLSLEIKYDSDKDELTWTYYLLHVLGVVEDSQNVPQINQNGINTRNVLFAKSGEKLRTYYKSQCYYIWWLRHSNDGDEDTNGVMEYAVVRNNIYKVSVNSIYSLGGDIPDNQQLDARVYVNKWSLLDRETLPM